MRYRIESLATFDREVKRLGKRYLSIAKDIIKLREELLENPFLSTDLGGGLRKIRMRIASKGKGKSSGARVITFTVLAAVDKTEIDLLYIYDKAEREGVSADEILELLKRNGLK